MVKGPLTRCLFWACVMGCLPALRAKDLADYHVGDTAEEDITTPVALDVIDPEATPARRAAVALATPAIFRSFPEAATNAIVADFQATFTITRSNFLAAVRENFPPPDEADSMVGSPGFAEMVAAFNNRNKYFPVPEDLAADWARGDAGLDVQARLLNSLLQMMRRTVSPDQLPAGFTVGETLRLVPVGEPNTALSLNAAERNGRLITSANLTAISHLRALWLRTFPENQQALARALGAFLIPNCVPDAGLTQQARDQAVSRLVAVDHYDAGQIVAQRGAVIDAKIEAALGQLREKTMPGLLARQIDAERALSQRMQEQAQQDRDRAQREEQAAQQARDQEQKARAQAAQMREQAASAEALAAAARQRNQWFDAALECAASLALWALWYRLRRQREQKALVPAVAADLRPRSLQAELAPYLAQTIKDVLVQELAVQRNELLKAQQSAALEIAGLVRRLDDLQVPLQERLQTYEAHIQKLEKELAVRTEENRELLKLKIEMMRRQLETERARNQMAAGWGMEMTE
jgi:hypothetical protein